MSLSTVNNVDCGTAYWANPTFHNVNICNDLNGRPVSDYAYSLENASGPGARILTDDIGGYVLRRLVAGTNVTLEENPNNITINASGGGGNTNNLIYTATNYVVQTSDQTIVPTTNSLSITLPACSTNQYRILNIHPDPTVSICNITPNGSDSINLKSSYTILDYRDGISIQSDGISDWNLILAPQQLLNGSSTNFNTYVSTSGNDNNNGLTVGTPVATIQGALQVLNNNGWNTSSVVNLGAGSFAVSNKSYNFRSTARGSNDYGTLISGATPTAITNYTVATADGNGSITTTAPFAATYNGLVILMTSGPDSGTYYPIYTALISTTSMTLLYDFGPSTPGDTFSVLTYSTVLALTGTNIIRGGSLVFQGIDFSLSSTATLTFKDCNIIFDGVRFLANGGSTGTLNFVNCNINGTFRNLYNPSITFRQLGFSVDSSAGGVDTYFTNSFSYGNNDDGNTFTNGAAFYGRSLYINSSSIVYRNIGFYNCNNVDIFNSHVTMSSAIITGGCANSWFIRIFNGTTLSLNSSNATNVSGGLVSSLDSTLIFSSCGVYNCGAAYTATNSIVDFQGENIVSNTADTAGTLFYNCFIYIFDLNYSAVNGIAFANCELYANGTVVMSTVSATTPIEFDNSIMFGIGQLTFNGTPAANLISVLNCPMINIQTLTLQNSCGGTVFCNQSNVTIGEFLINTSGIVSGKQFLSQNSYIVIGQFSADDSGNPDTSNMTWLLEQGTQLYIQNIIHDGATSAYFSIDNGSLVQVGASSSIINTGNVICNLGVYSTLQMSSCNIQGCTAVCNTHSFLGGIPSSGSRIFLTGVTTTGVAMTATGINVVGCEVFLNDCFFNLSGSAIGLLAVNSKVTIQNGSTATPHFINGTTGVSMSNCKFSIVNLNINGATGNGLIIQRNSNGAMQAVVGTVGSFGVALATNSRFSRNGTTTSTISGTSGNVSVGALGAVTWTLINGGLTVNCCDFANASSQFVSISA